MLVRFLSFVASVLGTARYKAIIFSCLALVFSLTGVAVMASWHGEADSNAASQVEQSKDKDSRQQGSPQLGEKQKQTIESKQPQQNTDDGKEPTNSKQQPDRSDGSDDSGEIQPNIITVSTASMTLAAGATSDFITATANNPGTGSVVLEIVADNNKGIFVEQQETVSSGIRFAIRTSADIKKDQTYEIIVVAKDASQKIVDSQTITVSIQQ